MIKHSLSVFSSVITIALVLRVALRWDRLPSEIPVHFSLFGQPDKYGPKITLGLLAASAVAVYFFLEKLPLQIAPFSTKRDTPSSPEDTQIFRLGLKAAVLMSLGVVVHAMSCLPDEPCLGGPILIVGAVAPPLLAVILLQIFKS